MGVQAAGADDFDTEWLALILGLKVVDGLDEALEHIRRHSTQHSDAIITEDDAHAQRFIEEVDSAGGVCQRQHPLQRRRTARFGRGDRRQHAETARAWSDGTGRTHNL